MQKYLSVVYDEKSHPYTEYPKQLCQYLYQLFELKPGMKMLEPGCGRGEFMENFQSLGLDVYGVDISHEATDFSKDFVVEICDVDNEPLPFLDKTFDVIYSKSFIEHLYYPEKFIKEAQRVLKPGGLLISLTPDWETEYKVFFDDYTHRTPFTSISLNDFYNIHGFIETKVHKFRQLPIIWRYPVLNNICKIFSPFIPIRTEIKFLKWSKRVMLIGSGKRPIE